jgi:hypothetical protein
MKTRLNDGFGFIDISQSGLGRAAALGHCALLRLSLCACQLGFATFIAAAMVLRKVAGALLMHTIF